MGILLNGNKPSKIIYNGAESSLYYNGSKIWPENIDYNPLNLPPNTVRVRTNDGNVPDRRINPAYETATLVPGTTNVYDVYMSGTSFLGLLKGCTNVFQVLGANTAGITDMSYMFDGCSALGIIYLFDTSSVTTMKSMFNNCSSLSSVPLFDTSSVTTMNTMFNGCSSLSSVPLFNTSSVTIMYYMFYGCSSLSAVPLFDTSSVTNMEYMLYGCSSLTTLPLFDTSSVTAMGHAFRNCYKIETGALALYQQASTQATPPSSHSFTFRYCGRDTTTGAAELAQIPTSWGGTKS